MLSDTGEMFGGETCIKTGTAGEVKTVRSSHQASISFIPCHALQTLNNKK
jgi:hypothetical protein